MAAMERQAATQLREFIKLAVVVVEVEQTQQEMVVLVAQVDWFLEVEVVEHRRTATLVRVALEETDS
jgi:uncharacterized protein YqiB (DUF1249 family)